MRKQTYAGINGEWIKSVGGLRAAAELIRNKLDCSKSKADKLAGRRYPSKVQPLEERALLELTSRGPLSVDAEIAS